MSRSKPKEHAGYLRMIYHRSIPDFESYRQMLNEGKFVELTDDFFATLSEKGFGFADLNFPPYNGMDTQGYLEIVQSLPSTQEANLEMRTVNGFNIFGSMNNDASLYLIEINGQNFVFLNADFYDGKNETNPVVVEKIEYGQPLLIHQILKRAINSIPYIR